MLLIHSSLPTSIPSPFILFPIFHLSLIFLPFFFSLFFILTFALSFDPSYSSTSFLCLPLVFPSFYIFLHPSPSFCVLLRSSASFSIVLRSSPSFCVLFRSSASPAVFLYRSLVTYLSPAILFYLPLIFFYLSVSLPVFLYGSPVPPSSVFLPLIFHLFLLLLRLV